jgi:hypothetical protein
LRKRNKEMFSNAKKRKKALLVELHDLDAIAEE